MSPRSPFYLILFTLILTSCGSSSNPTDTSAISDITVLINADIVTMDAANPLATAIAWSDAKIIAVGDNEEVLAVSGDNAKVIDLNGSTVVPGFFETHDHLVLSSVASLVTDISPFETPTLAEALEKIRATEVNEDGWIVAAGADQELYEERRGPTRDLLDEMFPETPVIVFHLSGHGGFANSTALELAGVDETTPDPQGGFLERDDNGRLTGYLAGQPALFLVASYPAPNADSARIAAEERAARGVTTASEFAVMDGEIRDLLVGITRDGDFPVRIVGGLFVTAPDFEEVAPSLKASQNDLLRFPFIKTWTDGSLQGGTAHLLDGYYDPDMGGEGAQGTQEFFDKQVLRMYELGFWPAVHANGDGAVEVALNAIEYAQKESGVAPDSGIRPQIIHAQLTRPEQIERMAELGVSPTFFTTHVYYWGDLHHEKSVGPQLVNRLSAMADGFKYDVHPSMHNDPPVSPVNPILNMWIAVNRLSSSGAVYGADQAITAEQALEAYTINGAYQFGLENETGSLEVGKLADFVVLDRNPLKIDKMEIRDIRVLATLLRGRQTYANEIRLQ
jgi:predicted amidohydrolase YtcJ